MRKPAPKPPRLYPVRVLLDNGRERIVESSNPRDAGATWDWRTKPDAN